MSAVWTIIKACLLAHYFFITVSYAKVTNTVGHQVTTHCEVFNKEPCTNSSNCQKDDKCNVNEVDGKYGCFALWKVEANSTVHLHMKGCFLFNQECLTHEKCVARVEDTSALMFCCCEGNYCNKEFFWEIIPPTEKPLNESTPSADEPSPNFIVYIVIAMVSVCVVIGIAAYYYLYYRKRRHSFNEWQVPVEDPSLYQPDTPFQGLLPVQLIEIKARGRFGAVWKAMHKTEEVAVKVFPAQDKQSWITEQDIFKLAQMEHANILHFTAAERRGGSDNMQLEYWLITAYHERGSLCDFLKAHTLTWTELCRVVETMARGLMHLHEELPSKPGHKGKPSIAHRDFKSKNVLLKSDLTACIADFGLALMFEPGKSCGDTHGQVGTRRYMAPEVLEGAINFTPDAFLRIDMYACGLVLWELVSRCTTQDGLVHEYRLPFEEEVGLHPTLEDMQESVVQRKVRPTIQNAWRNHAGLSALCDTMEECWDHDAEARLSASCVMERVMLQGRYQNCNSLGLRIENDALLINGKESSM